MKHSLIPWPYNPRERQVNDELFHLQLHHKTLLLSNQRTKPHCQSPVSISSLILRLQYSAKPDANIVWHRDQLQHWAVERCAGRSETMPLVCGTSDRAGDRQRSTARAAAKCMQLSARDRRDFWRHLGADGAPAAPRWRGGWWKRVDRARFEGTRWRSIEIAGLEWPSEGQ